MGRTNASVDRVLWVYVLVCVAVFAASRLEHVPVVGDYVHLVIAAIFLLTAIHLARGETVHFGIALGGLLVPPKDDRPRGPFGLWDLARAARDAAPSGIRELGIALAVASVIFPAYALAYYYWYQPTRAFALSLPPELGALIATQLVVVALPEEAFFRGYVQTALTDSSQRRARVLGVELAPMAWLIQAALFAVVHVIVEPHPARLAVFFPGLLFGWVRAWRGGIGAAIALHAMSNLYSEILARSWL